MQVAEKHHTDRNEATGRLQEAAWTLLLLAICICFFWKLVLTNQYTWLDNPDAANQVLPWYQFQAGEWHQGRFPLWDPYHWGGQPLLGQAQPGAAYPPNWLLFLAPLRNGWIRQSFLHWYFVLIHFQAALFCYWLCRDLDRSRPASLLAGLVFGLGGFLGTNTWAQMLNGAVWAPLIFLFFLRAMGGRRPLTSAAWSGVFLGVSFLSGHHQIPIFISLAMAGLWIYLLAQDRRNFKLLLLFGLFAVLVSGLQALPAYEYGRLSLRWVGAENPVGWQDKVPYHVHEFYALYPESIFGVVIPGMFRHTNPFAGVAALTLALLGVASSWEDRRVRLFAAVSMGGLLFALGHNSIFHGIIYALTPMVEKARSPSMAVFVFHAGLCVLVAYGIDGFSSVSRSIVRRAVWTLQGLAAFISVSIWLLILVKKPGDDRLGMVVLAALLMAAILTAWRAERLSFRAAVISLTLLSLLELGNVTAYSFPAAGNAKSFLKELSQHSDIAGFLLKQPGPFRVEVEEQDIPYNFGDWYGIEHFGGYLASISTNVTQIQASTRARMMYGIQFSVGRKPARSGQVEVFSGPTGIKVYRNPGAFPRAWTVHEARPVSRPDQMAPLLEDSHFDPRRQTLLPGAAPALETCQDATLPAVLERRSDRILLKADLKCRGMVIDAGTYFPGWVATVDGRPATVYPAYGFLRGVVTEAGPHRIELRYRPKAVYWGAALTLLGFLGATALTWYARD
jgi:hypothetical protein